MPRARAGRRAAIAQRGDSHRDAQVDAELEDVFIQLDATTRADDYAPKPRHDLVPYPGARFIAVLHEGVRADAARPADLRDDRRHPDPAADAVRLRDQHRSEGAAHGGRRADRARSRAASCAALENTGYFKIVDQSPAAKREADRAAAARRGAVRDAIPPDFSRRLLRGERPALLVAADATDPAATSNALAALAQSAQQALDHDLTGPLAARAPDPRLSKSACSGATTRRASRSTTSCPA